MGSAIQRHHDALDVASTERAEGAQPVRRRNAMKSATAASLPVLAQTRSVLL
jgi:hypothetical protein